MYNSIILFKKHEFHGIRLLFTKAEFNKMKNKFSWKIGPEGFVVQQKDYLNKKDLTTLKNEILTDFFEDFNIKDYQVQFSQGVYFFDRKEVYASYFAPIHKGACPYMYGDQIAPKTRPRQIHHNNSLEWYQEYGLFKSKNLKTNEICFTHPKTGYPLFKKENDYLNYLTKRESEMRTAKRKLKDLDSYIRLINVYSKEDKRLLYRIVFREFYTLGIMNMIEPYKGDDVYFFRSYKINKRIASYIYNNSDNLLINFNFDKYEYFMEVMRAEEFVYTYEEFVDGLKYDNK